MDLLAIGHARCVTQRASIEHEAQLSLRKNAVMLLRGPNRGSALLSPAKGGY